ELAAFTDAARVAFDQLAQGDVHRRFVHTGLFHVTADAIQLRSAVLLRPERRVPLGAFRNDERDVAEGFDVVHRGRLVVEPDHGRKRRLVPRLRALPFERLEERGLFARLVGAGGPGDVDLAVGTAA